MRGRLLLLLAALYLVRLVTLGLLPLFDSTEGRYAEIGREMAASGNWVTPTLHGGEPFWAKPPLHFWLTALSIRAFGANEWAARLPSLVVAALTLALVAHAARAIAGAEAARLAVLFLGTSGLFFLLSGTVIGQDLHALHDRRARGLPPHARTRTPRDGHFFFCFLGLGLLAKGLTAAILVLAAGRLGAVIRAREPLGPSRGALARRSPPRSPPLVRPRRERPPRLLNIISYMNIFRYLRKE
jgi:hypothetical protein